MTTVPTDAESTSCRRESTRWQAVLDVGVVTLGLLAARWLMLLVWPCLATWLTGPLIR